MHGLIIKQAHAWSYYNEGVCRVPLVCLAGQPPPQSSAAALGSFERGAGVCGGNDVLALCALDVDQCTDCEGLLGLRATPLVMRGRGFFSQLRPPSLVAFSFLKNSHCALVAELIYRPHIPHKSDLI